MHLTSFFDIYLFYYRLDHRKNKTYKANKNLLSLTGKNIMQMISYWLVRVIWVREGWFTVR